MVIWLISLALFAAWFVCKFVLGRGGFVHILLLCAIAIAVVQWAHDYRARQEG